MAGSLDGIRVVDLSRVLAGPYCAQMLADHGADVVKVESPGGDDTRRWGPPFVDDETSAYYRNLNRDKRNIVVDLRTEEGRDVVERLLATADVVVQNFKHGTFERWGWTEEVLQQRYPALVHCRITGFGTDGPLGGLPGYDAVLQAYSGLMSVNGEPNGDALRVGVPIVDLVTGTLAFSGIVLALHERTRSGRGQQVDVNLLSTALSLLHPHSGAWLADGTVGRRLGSAHSSIAPYENYPTRDGLIFIGTGNDQQFALLAAALDLVWLTEDPRFGSNSDRLRNAAELRALLRPPIAQHDRESLARDLLARGVPAAPVYDIAEALTAPQARHNGMLVDRGDGYRGIGIPIALSHSPGTVGPGPQRAGADTRAILAELGYDAEQIESVISRGGVRAAAPTGDPNTEPVTASDEPG
ncbi:CaiB/BaiF CoA transferase family protein [Pseudonocardia alni]|uniref:CaiB/BaiF CoA transferase family protein n=1 Tax=Pseudonocardia alni TaxID=33907 RepID=UPI0033343AA5